MIFALIVILAAILAVTAYFWTAANAARGKYDR